MDSLTQVVLGASCGELVLGKKIGNKAVVWGAIGGTIPDLDVFVGRMLHDTELGRLLFHRGIMHSLFFGIGMGLVLGYLVYFLNKKLTGNKNQTTVRDWQYLFLLAIGTHPLLDAFTSYGTQLFAPISNYRAAFNNISVVDPLYTLPFLVCLTVGICYKPSNKNRRKWFYAGLLVSSIYMLFTLANKAYVNSLFKQSLEEQGIAYSRYMTQPTIANNILWYNIAETEDAFYIANYSLFNQSDKMELLRLEKTPEQQLPFKDLEGFHSLKWFSNNYYRVVDVTANSFKYFDLRYSPMDMDDTNSFVFAFKVAYNQEGITISPVQRQEPRKDTFVKFWKRIKGK